MPSKDLKPKQRLGKSHPARVKFITWAAVLLLCAGGGYAAYHYTGTTEVEVAVARVRRADFIVSVRTRGDIKSAHSTILKAPQAPGLRITHLAENGRPVKKGDVVVQFDGVMQEQNVISRTTNVQAAEGDIVQMKATQKMDDEADSMAKMSSEYDLERSKLDASKADVLSAIEGEKNRIQVGVSEGALQQVKASINAHQVGHEADLGRLGQRKDKSVRDLETAEKYLGMMELRAPTDGVVNVLPNFRSQGTFGQSQPPFKEGDPAWTNAEIVEIPDLSQLYIDLKLEEVDRGRVQIGQTVKVRVDAIPDKEFLADLDYISPIAALVYKGGSTPEKTFPARATLKSLDDRLRPGMSASAEVIIEREPHTLLIPIRASFDHDGKPAVYVQIGKNFVVRPIQVGKRNDEDIIVTGGLQEGEMVTLESPAEAAKRAKKKL
ncbi:MAG TPA: efflux RND transporter periplasmic adaptor subunit [Bryobacteraceae bacterium]|jgi:multidrug efflux pump subunit AcrA (membrane-fusion protein)